MRGRVEHIMMNPSRQVTGECLTDMMNGKTHTRGHV